MEHSGDGGRRELEQVVGRNIHFALFAQRPVGRETQAHGGQVEGGRQGQHQQPARLQNVVELGQRGGGRKQVLQHVAHVGEVELVFAEVLGGFDVARDDGQLQLAAGKVGGVLRYFQAVGFPAQRLQALERIAGAAAHVEVAEPAAGVLGQDIAGELVGPHLV